VNDQLERSTALHNRYEDVNNLVHKAQMQFRSQVLAWKNIMLRGSDPEQLVYYEKAFNTASARCRSTSRPCASR
jgi:hypothetical protein